VLDKSSRHTNISDMFEGDKYLQLDLQERMEVGCRWQVEVPRGVPCVRFESATRLGADACTSSQARSAQTARLASLCCFQLQLAQPQRGAKRLPASRKPAKLFSAVCSFLCRRAACWRSVPRTKRRVHRQCTYQGLRMLQLAA
jgi:hypothetical protein